MGHFKKGDTVNGMSEFQLKAMKLITLRSHPNYSQKDPIEGESQISYAMRCAAHLVSPPQEVGESYDIECVDVRDGILSLIDDVEKRWNEFHKLTKN